MLNLNKFVFRSSPPEVFLGKGVLKICRKFTGEHPCRSAVSIKLQSNSGMAASLSPCAFLLVEVIPFSGSLMEAIVFITFVVFKYQLIAISDIYVCADQVY